MTFEQAREAYQHDDDYSMMINIEYELYLLDVIDRNFFSDHTSNYPEKLKPMTAKIAEYVLSLTR